VVRAGSTFNLGGNQALSTQTPVVKLEIIVQTDSYVKAATHEPAVENVHIVPSSFEPNWVGEVDGDLINDDRAQSLEFRFENDIMLVERAETRKWFGWGKHSEAATVPRMPTANLQTSQ